MANVEPLEGQHGPGTTTSEEPAAKGSSTRNGSDAQLGEGRRSSSSLSLGYAADSEPYLPDHREALSSLNDIDDDADSTPRSEVPNSTGPMALPGQGSSVGGQSSAQQGYFSSTPIPPSSPRRHSPAASASDDLRRSDIPRSHPALPRTPDPMESPNMLRARLQRSAVEDDMVAPSPRDSATFSWRSNDSSRDVSPLPRRASPFSQLQGGSRNPLAGASHPYHSRSNTAGYPAPSHDHDVEVGSKTVGHTPASSPSVYAPGSPSKMALDYAEHYAYENSSTHYHPRLPPKETYIADVDHDPITGRKLINQYEVLGELGRGVHGKVKLGRNMETGHHVAIKIVERYSKRRRLGKNASHEDKIKREIAILKKARHPNIVGLVEVIDDPKRKKVYIVLEHVELGEVRWRAEGPDEILLIQHRRFLREVANLPETEATAKEDEFVLQEANRRRQELREKTERERSSPLDTHEPHWGPQGREEHGFDPSTANLHDTITPSVYMSNENEDDNLNIAQPETLAARLDLETRFGSREHWENSDVEDAFGPGHRTHSRLDSQHSLETTSSHTYDVPENFRYVPLMTIKGARSVFRDAVLGLEFLHYQGVIHRDIKPANLLQAKDHHVKISDFGVSYLGKPLTNMDGDQSESEAPAADEAVELARTVGTPAFYAPELCQMDEDENPLPVNQMIDIWSLGVTLYCLVYGRVPFHDTNTFALMREIAEKEMFIPRYRLQAVEENPESRPSSQNNLYGGTGSGKRLPHELVYETVDDELRDLLGKLLVKDPKARITLAQVKVHPWILHDVSDPDVWASETDPIGRHEPQIEVSNKDLAEAVVPYHMVLERVRSGLRRIGGGISGALGIGKNGAPRKRAQSSLDGGRSSAHSSSSTMSQDSRRLSLKADEALYTALHGSREADHPLSHSVTASPEVREGRAFFAGPSTESSRSASPTSHVGSLDAPSTARPGPNRAESSNSTAGSTRTIRQSDAHRLTGQRLAVHSSLPASPLPFDYPAAIGLGGTLFDTGRRIMKSVRSRDRSLRGAFNDHDGALDQPTLSEEDLHGGPSLGISKATAAGRIDHRLGSHDMSPGPSSRNSPLSTRPGSTASAEHLRPEEAEAILSRQSSHSSVSSRDFARPYREDPHHPSRYSMTSNTSNDFTEERYRRKTRSLPRRRTLEDIQHRSRPQSGSFHPPVNIWGFEGCSPVPDGQVWQPSRPVEDDAFRTQILDRPSSAGPNSPTSKAGGTSSKPITTSSSEDQLRSTTSQSTSNPSIPSAISRNSSLMTDPDTDDTTPQSKELSAARDPDHVGQTCAPPVSTTAPAPDAGQVDYASHPSTDEFRHSTEGSATEEQDEVEDDHSSDGSFVEMTRRRSRKPSSTPNA